MVVDDERVLWLDELIANVVGLVRLGSRREQLAKLNHLRGVNLTKLCQAANIHNNDLQVGGPNICKSWAVMGHCNPSCCRGTHVTLDATAASTIATQLSPGVTKIAANPAEFRVSQAPQR